MIYIRRYLISSLGWVNECILMDISLCLYNSRCVDMAVIWCTADRCLYESRASPEKAIRQGYWNVSGAWGAEQCHITTLVPHSVHVDQWYWRGFVEPGMIGAQFVSYFFHICSIVVPWLFHVFFILFWYAFHMFYFSFIYISIFSHWRALYSWSSPPKKYPCVLRAVYCLIEVTWSLCHNLCM